MLDNSMPVSGSTPKSNFSFLFFGWAHTMVIRPAGNGLFTFYSVSWWIQWETWSSCAWPPRPRLLWPRLDNMKDMTLHGVRVQGLSWEREKERQTVDCDMGPKVRKGLLRGQLGWMVSKKFQELRRNRSEKKMKIRATMRVFHCV